jgi:hypothetical protein
VTLIGKSETYRASDSEAANPVDRILQDARRPKTNKAVVEQIRGGLIQFPIGAGKNQGW